MAVGGKVTEKGRIIALRGYFGDVTYSAASQFKIGIGSTTATIVDTSMEIAVPITPTYIDECDGVGTWSETDEGKAVSTDTTTFKEGYGTTDDTSLNITKDGTGGVTAVWSFDFGSNIDMTNDDLLVWFYIKDSSTLAKFVDTTVGVVIMVSTAGVATDYKGWGYKRTDLSVGWNLLKMDISSTADHTLGSTNIATIRYFRIYYTTTGSAVVTADGDVLMDFWHRGTRDTDYVKTYITGYPTFNESLISSTTRGYLGASEAIGYNLAEYGEFNSDGTIALMSHDITTVISKSSTEEITIEWNLVITE